MKITKRQLRRIIKEEAADCVKDYVAMGYSRSQAYKECEDYPEEGYGSRNSNYRPSPRKTSYVGSDANAEQIAAVEAALSAKPNNFLTSVLSQLKNGRGLSSKQKSIVKSIIKKTDPEAAVIFETRENKMKITKRQLRRIIREERARILQETADPKIESVAGIVQSELDRGKGDIFTLADVLQDSGLPAEYMSGMGMRYVQIPHMNGHIVIISKNSIEPDSETIIVGPYAIGMMG
jgi:hypothetical protein